MSEIPTAVDFRGSSTHGTDKLNLNTFTHQIVALSQRLDGLDEHLDGMGQRLDGMGQRLDSLAPLRNGIRRHRNYHVAGRGMEEDRPVLRLSPLIKEGRRRPRCNPFSKSISTIAKVSIDDEIPSSFP